MKKLSANGMRWLKFFHLIAVSSWIGGCIALLFLYFLKTDVSDGSILYGINQSIHHVDMWVVVMPGAFGCLATGLVYSLFTNWGFFKHIWIVLKWIITLAAIVSGTVLLGPWENNMLELSRRLGINALTDPTYVFSEKMNFIFGLIQFAMLVFAAYLSVFKPWKGKTK
ncbi:MAG TPA: DUF2269 family protein [Syntrophorhabdaceae bacterium]|nr:DUF2269 family protein [Syntrophorhabdaceae bacterium]